MLTFFFMLLEIAILLLVAFTSYVLHPILPENIVPERYILITIGATMTLFGAFGLAPTPGVQPLSASACQRGLTSKMLPGGSVIRRR